MNIVSQPFAVKALKSSFDMSSVISFVTSVAAARHRLTYAQLWVVALHFGAVPTNMSAGQRGASLVGRLPIGLQPFVCRSGGDYHPTALSAWTAPEGLSGFPLVGNLQDCLQQFQA